MSQKQNPKNILCVSYKDTCRGPMMAAAVRKFFANKGEDVKVSSAGMMSRCDGWRPNQCTVAAAAAASEDVSLHISRSFAMLRENGGLLGYDLFVCSDPSKREKLLECGVSGDILVLDQIQENGVSSPEPSTIEAEYHECLLEVLGNVEEVLTKYLQE